MSLRHSGEINIMSFLKLKTTVIPESDISSPNHTRTSYVKLGMVYFS